MPRHRWKKCGCVYRPPFASWEISNDINKYIRKAKTLVDNKKYNGLVIAGDLNHPNIVWCKCNLGGTCKGSRAGLSKDFLIIVNSNFFIQHVLEPTFADNILDLVITEDSLRIFTIEYGPPLGTSAKNRLHATLFWNYNLNYSHKLSIQTKNKILFHQCEFDKFRLSIESWSEATAILDMDPNLEYENLLSAYNEATSNYIPVKSVQVNQSILNNPKWFNRSIKKLTSLKYKLHYRLRASPNNNELQLQYKNQCASVKAAV